jgi:hypothetical protein
LHRNKEHFSEIWGVYCKKWLCYSILKIGVFFLGGAIFHAYTVYCSWLIFSSGKTSKKPAKKLKKVTDKMPQDKRDNVGRGRGRGRTAGRGCGAFGAILVDTPGTYSLQVFVINILSPRFLFMFLCSWSVSGRMWTFLPIPDSELSSTDSAPDPVLFSTILHKLYGIHLS